MYKQRPSLFYLLYNLQKVSPARLFCALHLQLENPWKYCPSFPEVLVESGLISLRALNDLRDAYGELDEEPLLHLLLDGGVLDLTEYVQIRDLHYFYPQRYVGDLMVSEQFLSEKEIRSFLSQALRGFAHDPHIQNTDAYIFECRELVRQRLIYRGYFSPDEIQILNFLSGPYLALQDKPLLDMLVVNGDIPRDCLEVLLQDRLQWVSDPLLPLLGCRGFQLQSLMGFIQKYPLAEQGESLAVRLVQAGQVSHHRLREAIMGTYRAALPQAA